MQGVIYAQTSVNGTVTDENGEALPGATVVEKGTTNGTVTDVEGRYRLSVSNGSATLVISFVGYTREEIPVGNRTTIDVNLTPDISSLQEVVVVGYGTQKRSQVAGAHRISRW